MADEILKRDVNRITVLGAITNDADQDIVMLRVDPITKRLLIQADFSGVAVTSINGLTGAVTLAAGTNISLGTVGNTITINSTGGSQTPWTSDVNAATFKLIGGTAVTDILKLQGTTGNGTLTSPAIQFLVGNNGATVAGTILNNGNVGIGTTTPDYNLTIYKSASGATPALAIINPNAGGTNQTRLQFYNNSAVGTTRGATLFLMNSTYGSGYNNAFGVWNYENGPVLFAAGGNEHLRITATGNVGIGTTSPTAKLMIAAGTATAGTAPLKFTSGTNLTTAEAGCMEFTTDDFFLTITTGAARKGIVLDDGTRLTSGKIPIASTNGRLIDGQTPLVGTKVYYVSDSSGGAVTRKLTFIDGILTSET